MTPMSFEDVIGRAKTLNSNLSVDVLLQGKTEPHGRKLTHNGFRSGSSANRRVLSFQATQHAPVTSVARHRISLMEKPICMASRNVRSENCALPV